MSILNSPDTVVVSFEDGVPTALIRDGIRYRVSDSPTPIRGSILHDLLTHPLEPIVGWRFQGTSESGETHVFDVHEVGRHDWRLIALYD